MAESRIFRCALWSAALILMLSGCSRMSGQYYYDKHSFRDYDIRYLHGEQENAVTVDPASLLSREAGGSASQNAPSSEGEEVYHTASVEAEKIDVYIAPSLSSRIVTSLGRGDEVEVAYYSDSVWQVKKKGIFLGYCTAGGMYSGIWDNYYAFLPEESGMAPLSDGTLVPASSHLVDVRLYTDALAIKMKLATSGTSIGEPFYNRNLCLLQYDTLQKLLKAAEMFEKDGFTIVIYDAYRPTSVQQRWFDVIRVHKWVADPSIGMGGIHDRGVAVDMTLMDKNGVELDMPTAMHTLTEAASRYAAMTDVQKQNVNYMTNVMVQCGFDFIRSEWWHFQDTEIEHYLPTDHPIDEIPLVYMERGNP